MISYSLERRESYRNSVKYAGYETYANTIALKNQNFLYQHYENEIENSKKKKVGKKPKSNLPAPNPKNITKQKLLTTDVIVSNKAQKLTTSDSDDLSFVSVKLSDVYLDTRALEK